MQFSHTADGRPQIALSSSDDSVAFEALADRLCLLLGAQVVKRLDGLDSRYWDIAADAGTLTLHSHPMVGITLASHDPASDPFLTFAAEKLSQQ